MPTPETKKPEQPKLLVIDDDHELGTMLVEFLAHDQFDVTTCTSGEAGLDLLQHQKFELIILDIMMPGMNGMEVLKTLRNELSTPVIMLTARGDDVDRILGLEFGADDYLTKPFNPRELLARIRAILRRSQSNNVTRQLDVGELRIDARAASVKAGDATLNLTGTEFALLHCLAQSPGQIVSKDTLAQEALGRRHMPYDRSIDTHLSNVRRKLANAGVASPTIQSRRGVGYSLLLQD